MKRTPLPAIDESILRRKGARTTADVPADVRKLLDAGLIESVNLCEWLVVDQAALAERVFAERGWSELATQARQALAQLKTPTAPKRMAAIGGVLTAGFPEPARVDDAFQSLAGHASDTVRSWAGYLVGLHSQLSLRDKLERIRVLAADRNMGVRETAWFAVRESLANELTAAIKLLKPFVRDADPNVRRFASEATRPRGVWCRHIQALKDDPSPGLVLLEPLRSDSSKYVRDSVANWLNDASKSQPDWVRDVVGRWRRESETPETAYIAKRALRTIGAATG